MIIDVRGDNPDGDRPAELIAGLLHAGKLDHFVQMVMDGHPVWHAICFFEEDLLAFEFKNRWCGSTDGWTIAVGIADELEQVPEYVGYGHVAAWLEYEGMPVVVIPGFGVTVWADDEDGFGPRAIATVKMTNDSAIHLNRVMRAWNVIQNFEEMLGEQ